MSIVPMTLSAQQYRALEAACDAFIPSLSKPEDPDGFWARAARDLNVAEAVVTLVEALDEAEQHEFSRLLTLLGSPLVGLTWGGPIKPFHRLSPAQQERLLQRWAVHPLAPFRKGVQSLKKLATFFFYALMPGGRPNPNWKTIGYPGPLQDPPALERPIRPLVPACDEVLTCDVVVVGSGAGGGVVAGELAAAGLDVLVVEKGPYVAEDGFTQREAEMMDRLYERKGALTTRDGGVNVLAGSCLGGGTTVNWTGAFRTPDAVLAQWAGRHEVPHLMGAAFQESLRAVERATHVDTDESPHNPQNQALADGARALGYHVAEIPRNVRGCIEDGCRTCGYCGLGCQRGTKQSTLRTYLQTAFDHGARILADTEVVSVLVQNGRAAGVRAVYEGGNGRRHAVTIHASVVVVAAGALHTPALLMRSGVAHPHLGRHLYLHPTISVAATYAAETRPWFGPMMSAVSNEVADLEDGYGAKLETPPVHSGLMALAMPWQSGEQHKRVMMQAAHVGSFIVLTRDRDGGRVTANRRGRPVLHYRLSEYDRSHMLRGVAEAARIHRAAGAETIYFPHNNHATYRSARGEAGLEALLRGLSCWRWDSNHFPLFSAHQMGTCRMGGDGLRHPVTPDGEVRGVRNLYVADASTFPASSGVNPMLSIQAIAHYTAQGIKARHPVRTTGLTL